MISAPLKTIDAFAGIGGFALGLEGISQTVAFIEWDQEAQQVLMSSQAKGKLASAAIFGDVCGCTRATMGLGREKIDLMTGGFPCQDVSNMGKMKGLKSKRSGLFYQLLRLCDELKPAFLYLENVPALLKHLRVMLRELDERGYDARWTTLSARNLGAPHYRNRIFILACRRGDATAAALGRSQKRANDARYASDELCFSVCGGEESASSAPRRLTPGRKPTLGSLRVQVPARHSTQVKNQLLPQPRLPAKSSRRM